MVDSGDFTFIQIHFLQGSEANCCGALDPGDATGPVTSITVEELRRLGMAELAVGDLNHDGTLDQGDVAAFLAGARPGGPQQFKKPSGGSGHE